MPMIPEGLEMTAGFLFGGAIGTSAGALIVWCRAEDSRRRAEAGAFIRGRNCERVAHGEELLVPPPHLDEIRRHGVGA